MGAGGGCLDIFTLDYPFSPLSPSLWETARYRLKYCLKGPLNPKQPTNQPLAVREGCKVGVSEFHSLDDLSQLKTIMCIHSNICEESVLRSKEQSVLRIIYPKSNTNISFNPIYYMHTRYSEFRDIEIYITDIHNNFCTFLKKPLSFTLSFK